MEKTGEYHQYNPNTVHLLQQATWKNDYEIFKKYSRAVNVGNDAPVSLRALLELRNDREAIAIEEVEPIENILKRFATGAMSFGSISWEAHTTLAIAMNRIGAKSNTGEGVKMNNVTIYYKMEIVCVPLLSRLPQGGSV